MKTYKFIKGWMTGGTLKVSQDGVTSMFDENGKQIDFRQIDENEVNQMHRDGMLEEV